MGGLKSDSAADIEVVVRRNVIEVVDTVETAVERSPVRLVEPMRPSTSAADRLLLFHQNRGPYCSLLIQLPILIRNK